MIKNLAGFQYVIFFIYGAVAFHKLTGAGTGTSFLVGGIGGAGLVGILFMSFPKAMLTVATVAWTIGGLFLGNSLFGSVPMGLLLALILGGTGWVVNLYMLSELRVGEKQGADFMNSVLPPITSAKDKEGLVLLWHSLRRLDRIKVIDDETFRSLNGKFASMLGMPNPPEGSAPPRTNDVADAFEAVSLLKTNGFVPEDQAQRIKERIEVWFNAKMAPPPAISQPEPKARRAMEMLPDGSLSDTEREILAAYLPKLTENRALSVETFKRVMADLDKNFDGSHISDAMFPFDDTADEDDLETIARLHKAGLLTTPEYRRGLQVLGPMVSSK